MNLRTSDRIALSTILAILVAAYAWAVNFMTIHLNGQTWTCLQDDSMISMRYAYNAAHGVGLVWNAGEHVQGFTNLGWTLLMTVVHFAGLPLQWNSLVLEIVNGAVLVAIVAIVFLSLKKTSSLFAATMASALIAFNPSMFIYSVTGFESTLQALFLVLAYLPMIPRKLNQTDDPIACPSSMVYSALATIVRPDAILYVAWTGLASWLQLRKSDMRSLMKPYAVATLSAALIVAAMFAFQYIYYGSLLPNTFYLKATGPNADKGWAAYYLASNFVLNPQGILLVATLVYLFLCARNSFLKEKAILLGALVVGWIGYVFSVGGDCFLEGRFFTSITPLMAICTSLLVEQIRRPLAAVIIVFAVWCIVRCPSVTYRALAYEKWINESSITSVLAMKKENVPTTSLIAVVRAGATPYFLPEYKFHDMLGKSETYIAHTPTRWGPPGHNKWDIDYTLAKVRPDLVIIMIPEYTDERARTEIQARQPYAFLPELWLDKTFKEKYLANRLPLPADLLNRMQQEGNPFAEKIFVRK